jgi:thiamine pyrophosphate-dependent acetolactate synthase large subunit-like protein
MKKKRVFGTGGELLVHQGVIRSIWDALVNAERPLLMCGQDIDAAGAGEEILTLAERLALPVATGVFDYASFPAHHPNYVGASSSGASPRARHPLSSVRGRA